MAALHNKEAKNPDPENMTPLERSTTIQLTSEQFEKLYLQPFQLSGRQMSNVQTFGNPTALGLLGFCINFTVAAMCFMSWGNLSPSAFPALTGLFFLFGGLMQWIASIQEWILGNTFAQIAFASFGSFWFVFGFLSDPAFGLAQAVGGQSSGTYNDAIGTFVILFGVYCSVMTLCCFRINVIFVIIFSTVTIAAEMIGAGFYQLTRNPSIASRLFVGGGAFGFVSAIGGWYYLAFLILASVHFPFALPVGDLSKAPV